MQVAQISWSHLYLANIKTTGAFRMWTACLGLSIQHQFQHHGLELPQNYLKNGCSVLILDEEEERYENSEEEGRRWCRIIYVLVNYYASSFFPCLTTQRGFSFHSDVSLAIPDTVQHYWVRHDCTGIFKTVQNKITNFIYQTKQNNVVNKCFLFLCFLATYPCCFKKMWPVYFSGSVSWYFPARSLESSLGHLLAIPH